MILLKILVLMLVLLPACSKTPAPPAPPQTLDDLVTQLKAQPSETKVKLLFVISAKKGMVHRMDGKGAHMFVFNKKDLTAAVLVNDNAKIGITVLTGLVETPDSVLFSLNRNAYKVIDAADKLTTHLVNPTLIIDSGSIITAGGVAVLLQQGAKACAAVECWWALAG